MNGDGHTRQPKSWIRHSLYIVQSTALGYTTNPEAEVASTCYIIIELSTLCLLFRLRSTRERHHPHQASLHLCHLLLSILLHQTLDLLRVLGPVLLLLQVELLRLRTFLLEVGHGLCWFLSGGLRRRVSTALREKRTNVLLLDCQRPCRANLFLHRHRPTHHRAPAPTPQWPPACARLPA